MLIIEEDGGVRGRRDGVKMGYTSGATSRGANKQSQLKCSPLALATTYPQHGRCMSDADIRLLAEAWNTENARRKNSTVRVGASGGIAATIHDLSRVLGPDMSSWIDSEFVRKDSALRAKLSKRFRPKSPKAWHRDPRTWLSTVDIEKVMKQYEASHTDFQFLGVFPRDFTSVTRSSAPECLAGAHVCNLKPGEPSQRKHMGIVFNLDRHDQKGSHWVCCFVSVDPDKPMYGAYYYDSVARPPPMEVAKWMLDLRSRLLIKSDRKFEVVYNRVRRQFYNTECGMFVIRFLTVAMENNKTFETISNEMGYDDDMNALRRVMFRW